LQINQYKQEFAKITTTYLIIVTNFKDNSLL